MRYVIKTMNKELAHPFILACHHAEVSFETWLSGLEEMELKAHFRELAEVRSHLHDAIEKVGEILGR